MKVYLTCKKYSSDGSNEDLTELEVYTSARSAATAIVKRAFAFFAEHEDRPILQAGLLSGYTYDARFQVIDHVERQLKKGKPISIMSRNIYILEHWFLAWRQETAK